MNRLLSSMLALVVAALCAAQGAVAAERDGQIVFRSNRDEGKADLYLMNRDGSGVRRLTYLQTPVRAPAWSPDGSRIAFAAQVDGNFDVYTVRSDGTGLVRVTTDAARDDHPRWTADGRLVFQRGPFACPCAVWIANADGTGASPLPTGPGNTMTADPAPQGTRLVFANDGRGTFDLYTMQLDGSALRRITTAPQGSSDFRPSWSPSGNDVVFARDTNGVDNDLYVVHANGQALRRLTDTPTRAEESPSWAPSGDEIVFMSFTPDGSSPSRLHAIRPDGTGETALSTAYSAPLADTFDDGYRDGSLWHAIQDPGSSHAEANGRLELAIAADSTPGGPFNQVNVHYGSQCSLPGDYGLEVDFTLTGWPELGVYAALNAFFANAGVSRNASPWGQQAVGWSDGLGNGIASTITAGSFRLTRSGGVVNAFVRGSEPEWTLVFSGAEVAGDAVFGLSLTAPGDWYTGAFASVAFDDFRLVSGALRCPDWWADAFPDWGVAR